MLLAERDLVFFLYVRKLVVWNKCQRGSLNSVSICNYDSANFFLLSRWVHCSLFLCKLLQIVSFNALLLSTGTKKLISISALCMENNGEHSFHLNFWQFHSTKLSFESKDLRGFPRNKWLDGNRSYTKLFSTAILMIVQTRNRDNFRNIPSSVSIFKPVLYEK